MSKIIIETRTVEISKAHLFELGRQQAINLARASLVGSSVHVLKQDEEDLTLGGLAITFRYAVVKPTLGDDIAEYRASFSGDGDPIMTGSLALTDEYGRMVTQIQVDRTCRCQGAQHMCRLDVPEHGEHAANTAARLARIRAWIDGWHRP